MYFQLKKLTLTNFMGFRKETFNFSKGLTLVVGPNGSGKSSILEALALSFQIKERGNSVNTYIYKNADSAQIDLEAVWLEKPLSITSVFSKKGRKITRVIKYDGLSLENTVANNFLTKHFNEKSLIISFALQGNERFLTNSKMQNFKNFMELLQIDFTKELNLTKNFIRTLKQDITTETAQLHTHEGALQYIEKQISDIQTQLQSMGIVPTTVDKKEIELLEKECELKAYELNSLVDKKNNFEKVKSTLDNLNKIIKEDEASLLKVQTSLKDVHVPEPQNCENIKQDYEQKKNQLTDILKQIEETQHGKSSISSKLDTEIQRKNQIHSGICPTCLQKVENNILQNNDNEISNLKLQLTQIETKNNDLIVHKNNINQELQSLNEKIKTIEQINQQIPWMQQNRQNLEQNEHTLITKLEQNKKRKTDLESQNLSSSFTTEVDSLEKELNNLKNKKRALENQNKECEIFNEKKTSLENNLQNQKTQLKEVGKEKDSCNGKIVELETSLNEYMNVQQVFENIPKVHTQHVVKELEALMDNSAKLFGYAGIRIEMDDTGMDFFLIKQYNENKEKFEIEIPYHMCSSFQKNLINISCVLALCTLFDVPFICIDELDANADKSNTLKLSPLIRSMLLKAPIVSVTHSEALSSELLKTGEDVAILELKQDLIKQESFVEEF